MSADKPGPQALSPPVPRGLESLHAQVDRVERLVAEMRIEYGKETSKPKRPELTLIKGGKS